MIVVIFSVLTYSVFFYRYPTGMERALIGALAYFAIVIIGVIIIVREQIKLRRQKRTNHGP